MIAYKCKCCGSGELEPLGDGRKAICIYCNTVSVLPTLHPEAYNQANELRKNCDFDQAVMAFERIVSENPNDCESYWNLVLSRYGIEYVEDEDGSYVPTCHRMTYSSIMDDPDYQRALERADGFSYRMYQDEAQKIDRILKRAAQIAHSQPAYDVFISYKESDEFNHRTEDSEIAQNVYDALKDKHPELNIFLSRITLKEVAAGLEYEPIIFSALNTAKLMIVVGTKKEHLEATWVKNEWSRYRKMMDNDKNKRMAVVYKSMNISTDFPKELRLFSIQATEAVGFYLQDFIAGVEELLDIKTKPQIDSSIVYTTTSTRQIENLLLRAEQAMEMKNFSEAAGFYDKVLGLDAQCARAWWGLFRVETKDLNAYDISREFYLTANADKNWNMAKRYANDAELADFENKLQGYKKRWTQKYQENAENLRKKANRKKVKEEIENIKKETKDGTHFKAYSKYGPEASHMKGLISIAEEENKNWLLTFGEKYRKNYEKFLELQELKAANPIAMIKGTSKYQELAGNLEKCKTEAEKAKKAINGVNLAVVILTVILAISTLVTSTDADFVMEYLPMLAHIMPLLVGFAASYTIVGLLGLKKVMKGKEVSLVLVLTIAFYFFTQYVLVSAAQKLFPEISIISMFSGLIFVFILAFVGGFIIGIIKRFADGGIIAAIIFGVIYYFVGALVAGVVGGVTMVGLDYLVEKELTMLDNPHLIPTRGPIFTLMLVMSVVVVVIAILRYGKHKVAKANYESKEKAQDTAQKAYDTYYQEELEKYKKPFIPYVAKEYLEDMSKKDI